MKRKLLEKRLVSFVGVLILMLAFMIYATPSYAAITDSAGNQLAVENCSTINCAKDYYWAGRNLDTTSMKVGYDAILAGKYIMVTSGNVGGSFRAVGENIAIHNTKIAHNATIAGRNISVNAGTTIEGLYIAGQSIGFTGTATSLYAAGQDVSIDGTINGDVTIYAQKVTFGSNAVVTGKIKGTLKESPNVANGAKVPNMDFEIDPESNKENIDDTLEFLGIASKIFGIVSALVIGVLMCLVFKRPLASAGNMLKKKPVAMPVTGLISIFAVPIALILLLVTVIGIPISLLLFALYILILLTAVPFAGASAGMLIFPKWNRWGSAMLGTAVVAVVCAIPYLGVLVKFIAAIYALGFFVLTGFYEIASKKKDSHQ